MDEVPVVTLSFNSEFGGHELHSEPSKYKPEVQTQCFGLVEPVGAAENG